MNSHLPFRFAALPSRKNPIHWFSFAAAELQPKISFWLHICPNVVNARSSLWNSSGCPRQEFAPRGHYHLPHLLTKPSVLYLRDEAKYFSRHFVPLSIEGGGAPLFPRYFSRHLCTSFYRGGVPPSFQDISLGPYVPLSIEGCPPLS